MLGVLMPLTKDATLNLKLRIVGQILFLSKKQNYQTVKMSSYSNSGINGTILLRKPWVPPGDWPYYGNKMWAMFQS